MATTTLGLPYPDDYADPADSPAAFEALALATDAQIRQRARVYVQTAQPTNPAVGDIWAPV